MDPRRIIGEISPQDADVTQLWDGLLRAFFFCLGISELLTLQYRDIKFTKDSGQWVMSILIRESKTDQEKAGVTRMIRVSGKLLRHVLAMRAFIDTLPKSANPDTCLFPPSFRRKLVLATQWVAGENGIPMSVVNTHSLRAGGATALFPAGVDWVAIQRWGRWESFVFHQYIWHDHSGFMELGWK